jgi:hypothetical protein
MFHCKRTARYLFCITPHACKKKRVAKEWNDGYPRYPRRSFIFIALGCGDRAGQFLGEHCACRVWHLRQHAFAEFGKTGAHFGRVLSIDIQRSSGPDWRRSRRTRLREPLNQPRDGTLVKLPPFYRDTRSVPDEIP